MIRFLFLAILFLPSLFASCYPLPPMNWEPHNHQVLQKLIDTHTNKADRPYAVFDWDNTSIFHDCGDAFFYYQLRNLQFRLSKEELRSLLLDEINGVKQVQEKGKAYYLADLNADILSAYSYLIENYQGFHGDQSLKQIERTPQFLDFISKMAFLNEKYEETEGIDPYYNYTWVGFLMAHFSHDEILSFARAEMGAELTAPLGEITWKGPANYPSKAGPVEASLCSGIRTRPEIQSLMALLRSAGIEVYVISGSFKVILEAFATPGALGYNVPADHIFGLELEEKKGKFLPAMKKGGNLTFSKGKAETIQRFFKGRGDPLLVCGDNDNDIYMLSLPKTKLGLIVNRLLSGKIKTLADQAIRETDQENPRYLLQGFSKKLGIFIPSQNTN